MNGQMISKRDVGKDVITPKGLGKLWRVRRNTVTVEMDHSYLVKFAREKVKLS